LLLARIRDEMHGHQNIKNAMKVSNEPSELISSPYLCVYSECDWQFENPSFRTKWTDQNETAIKCNQIRIFKCI